MKKEYITPQQEIVEMTSEYGILRSVVSGNVTVDGDEDEKLDIDDDPMHEQVP